MANIANILLNLPQVLSHAGRGAGVHPGAPSHRVSVGQWPSMHYPGWKGHRDDDYPEGQNNH